MLVMSAAFRTAVAFTYPQAASNESLFYPLQVLPEMIQAILMALPLFLMQVGRAAHMTHTHTHTHTYTHTHRHTYAQARRQHVGT